MLRRKSTLLMLRKAIASYGLKPKFKKGTKDGSSSQPITKSACSTFTKPKRGVIFISHLPNGFYEKEISKYFSQFGIVTGIKLPRSKTTGRSRGYAYVQFLHREVAEIAAETMNNYLMINRIIKAILLSPKNQRMIKFGPEDKPNRIIPTTPLTCERAVNRRKFIARRNAIQSELKYQQMVYRENGKIQSIQMKLSALGIPKLMIL